MDKTMKKVVMFVMLFGLAAIVHASEQADAKRIKEALAQVIPGQNPDSIKPAPVGGMYEVSYGTQVFYVSADGRYVISGDLVDLKGQVNLTEQRRADFRRAAMDKISADAIVYAPKEKAKHVITVFTDADCGYCRKLHSGMKEMNDLGIEVRYLAYPRAGVGTPSFEKAVSIWCAKDRNKAMDVAKNGGEPAKARCQNTVAQQLSLGNSLGVQGTPAILLDDGRMVPGYVPPQRLAQILEGK
jgi:thiol:disulfide interchange protein DsbC